MSTTKRPVSKTTSKTSGVSATATSETSAVSKALEDTSAVIPAASAASTGTRRRSKVHMQPASSAKLKTLKSSSRTGSAGRSYSRIRARRHSYGFSAISGVKLAGAAASSGNIEYRRPPLLFLPTYQLESNFPFNPIHALDAVKQVINTYFTEHRYNETQSPILAMGIAQQAMRLVKALGYNRYRIFSVVTIGQKRAQSYNNAVSFLWDAERDSYVDAHEEVHTAFIQVTVFAVYLD